ncbi:MAG: hypothetical protein K0R61_743 [Microvirga sp.]|jgi:hypothetical protein|nr:hypothetical protein [Microvirga sp.]MCD6070998.1 hypothetical protein [Microvirga sp.]MDF2970293.1 hypothetical protein [Microvirga sp.]
MVALGTSFNANNVPPAQDFSVLPAGEYLVQVVASEMRSTKNGSGRYLWLEMEILDGEYQSRKMWDRLNLENTNPQAVQIAQRQLSALCHAVGEAVVEDSEQLHNKPVIATVRVRPEQGAYSASNEIRGYKAPNGRTPQSAATNGSAPAPAGKPWKRAA